MARTDDRTTLICLFHHQDQAVAAVNDLHRAGIAQEFISQMGGKELSGSNAADSSLAELGVPERDKKHLLSGLNKGGVLLIVSAEGEYTSKVEGIFNAHRAEKIDETDTTEDAPVPLVGNATANTALAGDMTIPIVEEEVVVGKRNVDQGGVRVYRRIIEVPVNESVNLREEHVSVDRRPIDRAATDADLAMQGDHTIELTETAEEAVISKNAHVVEEIQLGKSSTERTQHIQNTVRKTVVDVEEIDPDDNLRR